MPYSSAIKTVVIGCSLVIACNADDVRNSGTVVTNNIEYLEQGWKPSDRKWFYDIDQGSRLIPYRIFLHLEQADNQQLLRDPSNMIKYGFLPSPYTKHELPIGFSKGDGYLGLTCAACHTQPIQYQSQTYYIDGGQSMMDLPMFLAALEKSLQATKDSPEKYQRFENNVLGANATAKQKNLLAEELTTALSNVSDINIRNHSSVEYGYSRLDAFGNILNKALSLTGVENNFNAPDAPTSYPYIWDTPQHDYVEWNGSQSNASVGALARNVGEVIGVFGKLDPTPSKFLGLLEYGYSSSIQARTLRKIEMKVSELQSPLWPEQFPALDQNKIKQGRTIYETHCLSCHLDIQREDPKRYIKVRMSTLAEIKTDPWMAKNAVEAKGESGILNGKPRFYSKGSIIQPQDYAIYMVNNLMVGVLKNNPLQAILAKRDAKKLGQPDMLLPPKYVDGEIIEKGQESSKRALLSYKARPLNGIWTAAPYLHNGSVPNLYELLLPAEQRSGSFYVGSWQFDPIKVGYVSEQTPNSIYFDTSLKGNSNAGHEYGTVKDGYTKLTEPEIWALLEYLKSL